MTPAARSPTGNPQIVYRPPPNMERQAYPPHRIAAVVATLAEDGIPPESALAGSGLAEAELSDNAKRVSLRQIETVFRNALRLTRDPAIALRAGQRMRVTAYGIYGYAILSSRSVADSIAFSIKCHRILGAVVDMSFSGSSEEAVWGYEPVLSADPAQDIYRFCMEFALSAHLRALADALGQAPQPRRVGLAYPAPPHARQYEALLKCPVQFEQPNNEMAFDAAWLMSPMPLADPLTSQACRETCEQLLSEMNLDQSLASDIRSALILHPGRFPSIEAMAERLSMHPRALRRRLSAENTSYRDLLAEVRSRLAIEYLRRTNMTNDEIAARLGYSDAANFRRAFSSWTGKSPSAFRGGPRFV